MFDPSLVFRASEVLFPRFCVLLFLFIFGIGNLGVKVFSKEQSSYPSRPVKVVVPFAAGGGSDVLARILLSGVQRSAVSREPLVVLNVGGAGGTIGSRRVKNAEPDGYEILALHDGIFTAKQFGKVDYGYESFVPIAATGRDGVVVAVRDDSRFGDLRNLLHAIRDQPDSVVFGANLGAPSQLTGLLLESGLPGAKFRYSQTGGGSDRLSSLLGGHVEVTSFSIAEYLRFKEAGVRALAYMGKDEPR
jgi:tripartite-type tricarboxylate transporter receptor subunit TctC